MNKKSFNEKGKATIDIYEDTLQAVRLKCKKMTKKLTHYEAREILLNGGKVDGYNLDGRSYNCNPIEFNNKKLRTEDCEGDWIDLYGFTCFTEHKEPEKFEYWVNVYPNGGCSGHRTKKLADESAVSDRIACVKISGKEGDGLE